MTFNEQRHPKTPIDPETALQRLLEGFRDRQGARKSTDHEPLSPEAALERLLARQS
jgi:hypothetical protein